MNPGRTLLAVIVVWWGIGEGNSADARPGGATDSLYRAGVQFYIEGQYAKAINVLERARADTLTPSIAFYLGAASATLNDFKSARQYLQRAVDMAPDNISYRFQFARFLSQAGLLSEAEKQYAGIVERDSSFTPALSNLGLISADRKDYQQSIAFFLRVVRQNPRDYVAYYDLGGGLTNMGFPDSAREYLSTCLTLNPDYIPALSLLATSYYRNSEYHDALRLLAHLQALRPDNADFVYRGGLCYEKIGNSPAAVSQFRKATVLDSVNEYYFAHLGQAYFRVQQFDSCVIAYQRAATINNENPLLFLNIAMAWQKLDSTQRAAEAFRTSIATYHPEAIASVYRQLGALYYNGKHYRDARNSYRKALEWNGKDMEAMFYLAVCQDKLRNAKAAAEGYRGFLKVSKGSGNLKEQMTWANRRLRELTKETH